jgi:hypothetical protein
MPSHLARCCCLVASLAQQLRSVRGDPVGLGCDTANIGGYASPNGCTLQAMRATPLRVVYLDKQYVTQNQAAIEKAKSLGRSYVFASSCEKAATALPEWSATSI